MDDLKLMEKFINGSTALYLFNDCIFYLAKNGIYFFIHKDDPDISNKDEISLIKEYYTTHEQYLASKQKYKEPIKKDDLLNDLKWK